MAKRRSGRPDNLRESNEHSERYMKVRSQLESWISNKTRVTIGFYDNPLAGSVSGELSRVEGPYKQTFFRVTAIEGAHVTICPLLAETLSIENDEVGCKIGMKWRDCEVVVGPFVDIAELLKALPVPPGPPS
jgi:hypothetical protein